MALFSVLTPFEEKRQDDYQVHSLVRCMVKPTLGNVFFASDQCICCSIFWYICCRFIGQLRIP